MAKNKPHPDPNKHGIEQYKRHVDGSIRVTGQIEVHPPPNANQEETPEQKKDHAYRFLNFVVSASTLLAVVIYAGLTAWQACLSREAIDDNGKQFQIQQRPYVWWSGSIQPNMIHIVANDRMWVNIHWINYGKSPAIRTAGIGKIFIGPHGGWPR